MISECVFGCPFYNICIKPPKMHQQYLSILLKFYEKMVQGTKQAQLLNHSIERFLNFQLKEQEKMIKQREKEGSDIKSFKSGSSNTSLSHFEKVKKLFYSNHMETAILFYYCLRRLKAGQGGGVLRLFNQINDKMKGIKPNSTTNEERRKFSSKLSKFMEQLQFLEGKVAEGRAIDWLYFQVFKEFESQAVLTAQLLSSPADTLQTKEGMKVSEYGQLLKALKAQIHIFDYTSRQVTVLGSQGESLFIGRRSDTYFVLTQKQFQKATSNQAIMGSRKQLQLQKQKQKQREREREQRGKEMKSYTTNKFKQEFLAEMLKLRQGYQVNTATIATLFHFKDAGEGRTFDETNQA